MKLALPLTIFFGLLGLGCDVGGSTSAGGAGGGGEGPTGCIAVDCSVPGNEEDVRCTVSTTDPGDIGEGPAFLGQSPQVLEGTLVGDTLYVGFSGDATDDAIFAVDIKTGDRTFVSGMIEDPAMGPEPRGAGPALTTLWDLVEAPNGGLYALADNEMGRQILSVDTESGDRALVVSLMTNLCMVGDEFAQLEPNFKVGDDGNILMVGFADGGSGLFEINVGSGVCTTVSFASEDENAVGSGPFFYDFQTFTLLDGKAYVSDAGSSSLVEIDLETGARIRVSSSSDATPIGEGPSAVARSTLAFGESVFAADTLNSDTVLVETDLSDAGNRTAILSTSGPISSAYSPWLYGERDGCFYFGAYNTLYAFHAASGLSNRISH